MLRLFIAADFTPEIIARIAGITDYLKTQTPGRIMKWAAPDNMHLTLKFLGDVREDRLSELKNCMREALQGQPSFNISVGGMGMYPNTSRPRVLWLGIKDDGNLNQIHHKLTQAVQGFDPEPEKRAFSPHLTIARIRQKGDRDSVQQVGKTLSQFKVDTLGTLTIHTVQLYKSELTPKGPIYTAILSVPLNNV